MSDNVPASAVPSTQSLAHIDLSKPRYDQSTFVGRAKHFYETVNPLNLFASSRRLAEAAQLVKAHKRGETPAGTKEDDLWGAKRLYDSAYHPDTGEKMFLLGRMSFQVPGNMTIVGLMLTFYKSNSAVIFWQFTNQTFNALVNYTNRSGNEIIAPRQILVPYLAATSGATITALTLNHFAKRMPPLIGRFVPFVAVAAANSCNIPLMRQRELKYGIPIYDKDGNNLGMSTNAARKAIALVIISRITMASPGMILGPIILNSLERKGVLKRLPWLSAPLQVSIVGFCLVFATPLGCALFPQQSSISVAKLESQLRDSLQLTSPNVTNVYFNRGL